MVINLLVLFFGVVWLSFISCVFIFLFTFIIHFYCYIISMVYLLLPSFIIVYFVLLLEVEIIFLLVFAVSDVAAIGGAA